MYGSLVKSPFKKKSIRKRRSPIFDEDKKPERRILWCTSTGLSDKIDSIKCDGSIDIACPRKGYITLKYSEKNKSLMVCCINVTDREYSIYFTNDGITQQITTNSSEESIIAMIEKMKVNSNILKEHKSSYNTTGFNCAKKCAWHQLRTRRKSPNQ